MNCTECGVEMIRVEGDVWETFNYCLECGHGVWVSTETNRITRKVLP